MTTCDLIIYMAPDVDPARLNVWPCDLCGRSMADHPCEVSNLVPPGMAYRVNPALVGRLDLYEETLRKL